MRSFPCSFLARPSGEAERRLQVWTTVSDAFFVRPGLLHRVVVTWRYRSLELVAQMGGTGRVSDAEGCSGEAYEGVGRIGLIVVVFVDPSTVHV